MCAHGEVGAVAGRDGDVVEVLGEGDLRGDWEGGGVMLVFYGG